MPIDTKKQEAFDAEILADEKGAKYSPEVREAARQRQWLRDTTPQAAPASK